MIAGDDFRWSRLGVPRRRRADVLISFAYLEREQLLDPILLADHHCTLGMIVRPRAPIDGDLPGTGADVGRGLLLAGLDRAAPRSAEAPSSTSCSAPSHRILLYGLKKPSCMADGTTNLGLHWRAIGTMGKLRHVASQVWLLLIVGSHQDRAVPFHMWRRMSMTARPHR